ncbi:MAG TPA: hypothetical protein VM347_12175 [Nonomuraea sp.]|nr:hypothetical protein [Nonomuraea sp.]
MVSAYEPPPPRSRRAGRRRRSTARRSWVVGLSAGAVVLTGATVWLLGTDSRPAPRSDASRVVFEDARPSGGTHSGTDSGSAGDGGSGDPDLARGGTTRIPMSVVPTPASTPRSGGAPPSGGSKNGTPASAGATAGFVTGGDPQAGAPLDTGAVDPSTEEDASDYKADGPSTHTDQEAAEYFRTHWPPDDKAAKHLKDIRSVGGYLRLYTDLPESAGNSSQAITLCERGLRYLRESGEPNPIVFVQAKFGENGNPVLANILGPADKSCRVTHPEPD